MTRQKVNAPEFAGTLGKILALEHQRGYNDRAVQGGLDRFRELWWAEMASRAGETSDAPFLLLQSYAENDAGAARRMGQAVVGAHRRRCA